MSWSKNYAVGRCRGDEYDVDCYYNQVSRKECEIHTLDKATSALEHALSQQCHMSSAEVAYHARMIKDVKRGVEEELLQAKNVEIIQACERIGRSANRLITALEIKKQTERDREIKFTSTNGHSQGNSEDELSENYNYDDEWSEKQYTLNTLRQETVPVEATKPLASKEPDSNHTFTHDTPDSNHLQRPQDAIHSYRLELADYRGTELVRAVRTGEEVAVVRLCSTGAPT